MKTIIITTSDLPKISNDNNSLYTIVDSSNLSKYVQITDGMPRDIKHYLETYKYCDRDVLNNLQSYTKANETAYQIPLLKRKFDSELTVYVTLCLDERYAAYGDETCHGYLNALIDDVISDFGESNNELFLLARWSDVVQEYNAKGLSRPVEKDELKSENLKNKLKNINIYLPSNLDNYQRNIINKLSKSDLKDEIFRLLGTQIQFVQHKPNAKKSPKHKPRGMHM